MAQKAVQEPVLIYNNKIKVTPMELRQRGKDLYIQMRVETRSNAVNSSQSVRLMPILVSSTGRTMNLNPMQINGRNEEKALRRAEILNGADDFTDNTVTTRVGKRLDYRQKVRYKPWMADARLDVVAEVMGCAGEWIRADQSSVQDSLLLQRMIDPYRMDLRYSYLLPGKKSEAEDPMVSNAYLEFPINSTEIRRNFRGNAAELEQVNYMIASVSDYTDVRIEGVEISGYASPEGPTQNNIFLAEGRAESMRSYLAGRGGKIPARSYKVTGSGEDWEGLSALIAKSPYANNTRLQEIVAMSDTEARKAELEALDNGQIYRQLHADLYPQLRRVTCRVRYELLQRGEGADRIGHTGGRPVDVTLDEMYQMALSYPRTSKAFNDVLESAAKIYEHNSTANLNAASAALTRGDLSAANKFLQRADRNLPEYGNVSGILEMLRSNYAVAEKLLRRASEAGVAQAEHNLAELQKKLDNIQAIKTEQSR